MVDLGPRASRSGSGKESACKELQLRNPSIKTFGLSWGVPGWVGEGNFFSEDNIHYQGQWVECMKSAYNVSIDLIGTFHHSCND